VAEETGGGSTEVPMAVLRLKNEKGLPQVYLKEPKFGDDLLSREAVSSATGA
jgi:hypothetical protein